jgi:hypothetical protein
MENVGDKETVQSRLTPLPQTVDLCHVRKTYFIQPRQHRGVRDIRDIVIRPRVTTEVEYLVDFHRLEVLEPAQNSTQDWRVDFLKPPRAIVVDVTKAPADPIL